MKEKFNPAQQDKDKTLPIADENFRRKIRRTMRARHRNVSGNLDWLYAKMPPYFFIMMKDEFEAIVNLTERLIDVTADIKNEESVPLSIPVLVSVFTSKV